MASIQAGFCVLPGPRGEILALLAFAGGPFGSVEPGLVTYDLQMVTVL